MLGSLQKDDDDEISNLVDLHMGCGYGGEKFHGDSSCKNDMREDSSLMVARSNGYKKATLNPLEDCVEQGISPKEIGEKMQKEIQLFIHPVSLDEHVALYKGRIKVRKLFASALPEDHYCPIFNPIMMMPKGYWMARLRLEEEGLHKGYDRFQKILSQLNQVQARPDNDDINLKFLRALPSSWSQVALALKTRGGLESMSFDDLKSDSFPSVFSDRVVLKRTGNVFYILLLLKNEQDQRYDLMKTLTRFRRGWTKDNLQQSAGLPDLTMEGLGCYKCLQIGTFLLGEKGNVKKLIDKAGIMLFRTKRKERMANVSLEETDSSMSTRTKIGLGFQENFGVDEVFDLSTPSVFYSDQVEKEDKPLYSRFVKVGEMHVVPPPITGTYMPSPYQSDIEETKGPKTFAGVCLLKTQIPTTGVYSIVPAGSRNSSASVTAGGSDPAASRNRPAVNSTGRPNPTGRVGQAVHLAAAQSNPAGWSKRPAPVSAGRPVSAGWLNPAARPYFRPSSVYFNNMYWPELYDPMYMNEGRWGTAGDPSTDNDIGIVDSGCSRSMTGNKEKLDDFVQVKGGIVKFGGGDGRISGKGTIRTSKLDFENVYYVEELQHFNLFSVSQICDKKNKVLFTDTDCLVLTEEFQLPDESQVVLRIPRERDLYTFSISELQPEQNVTCLVAKASLDESTRWHRRMAHVNFKTINKLAKEGLVDGLPLKVFTNEHNCVACNKGKQHKASYKHISAVRLITETLQLLHMDLFGPTNIRSIDQKYYSLVVTDDFSRFTWTFFLGTKDETFYVLKEFIALIENQLNKKVKGIRCDNGTEFKNAKLIELCGEKGIKRDYSNPRTPQQNGVAERKNRTLIEAARTMLADSKLPTMFWTEAVSTACYVLNRVSITNPHNKTPYELISGKVPQIGHLKPFGCQVTILNTSDHLGKFEGKADEGYLVGYAPNSKAYRVYNLTNKRVEETMNLRFLEDKPNVQGIGHEWYFDLDYLTDSLGYTRFKTDKPAGTQETNINAGTQDHDSDSEVDEQVIVVPSFPSNSFAGPSSSNGPSVMERNADYAEELAKLQRQEYEAKDAAARYGYLFSQED
ncbi:putative ribonuclease H-like domain-containing protein [Tanacetum coccineum]